MSPGVLWTLVGHHARTGARVSLRSNVAGFGLLCGALMLVGADGIQSLAGVLFGGSGRSGVVVAALLCGEAMRGGAARVWSGARGWVRHLPASGATHRRAGVLALAVVAGPHLLLLAALAALAAPTPLAWLGDLGHFLLVALWVALATVPARGRLPGLFVAAGGLIAGRWWLVLAVLGLAGADLGAGIRRSSLRTRAVAPFAGPLGLRVALRAVGLRALGAGLAGLLPLAAAAVFSTHNELTPAERRLALLLGATWGVSVTIAMAAEALARRRPPWPWARSLPDSASRRLAGDAILLALLVLPLLGIVGSLEPSALLPVALVACTLAVRGAGLLRSAVDDRAGIAAPSLAEGWLLGGTVALVPAAAAVAFLAVPVTWLVGARADRRSRISRFQELHHAEVGETVGGR